MRSFKNQEFLKITGNRIEKVLSFPGITSDELILRKNVWLSSFGSLQAVIGLTLIALLLRISLIVEYGLILIAVVLPALILIPLMRKKVDLLVFLSQVIILSVTLYYMIRLGGLLNSAGLLFTGMTVIIISISYQNTKYTVFLFIIYLLSIILVAVLEPVLVQTDKISPQQNLLFFTINCLWQAGFIMFLVINFLNQRRKLEEARKAEAAQLKKLDQVKTQLYTNITHEFRTPLTVIDGVVFQIEHNPRKWLKAGIEKIRMHIRILLNLISQILDYNKLEAGAMSVDLIQADLVVYSRYLVDSFGYMAKTKNISLRFDSNRERIMMDIDPDKIRQIIYNLVSNAIKYTPEDGTISVLLEANENNSTVCLKVRDNGIGIEPERLKNIFQRYYRAPDHTFEIEGTGLGLNITYELIKLIGATISVDSKVGAGTEFKVEMPWTKDAKEALSEEFLPSEIHHQGVFVSKKVGKKAPLILIVEDNFHVAEFLDSILSDHYRVLIENDGEKGFATAIEKIPDIIISDIMMPHINGYEMLRLLKNDIRTSHIPVILLTARVDMESRLEGFEYGAEAYLTKPFHQRELFVRIKKLLEIRQQLQQRYSRIDVLAETKDPSIRREDRFMIKLKDILRQNLHDEAYGIQEICREMGVSRPQLYRKFSALTNVTIGSYMKSLRLYRARELLSDHDLNVSEVAYRVGFKNPSHFSSSFHKEFGFKPSEKK